MSPTGACPPRGLLRPLCDSDPIPRTQTRLDEGRLETRKSKNEISCNRDHVPIRYFPDSDSRNRLLYHAGSDLDAAPNDRGNLRNLAHRLPLDDPKSLRQTIGQVNSRVLSRLNPRRCGFPDKMKESVHRSHW